MTRNELVKSAASNSGESIATVERVLCATKAAIETALLEGEVVRLAGLGRLHTVDRQAGGKDFKTGLQIPARLKRKIIFRPSQKLSDRLNANI